MIDRNEFRRGVLAAGAASFARSVGGANFTAHLEPSPALEAIKVKARGIAEQVQDALPLG